MTQPAPAPLPALPPDCHVHTVFCKHARGTLSEYREHAARRGIAALCFADHAPAPCGYDAVNRMTLDQFPLYRDMVRQVRDDREPAVLLGIEADYYEGCERFLARWLQETPFDLVIGSVHYIRDWGFDSPSQRERWNSVDVRQVWREYFALLGRLVGTRLYDVVGHFDLPKKFGHRISDRDLCELAPPVLDRVAAAGMAIEINTSGLRRPVGEVYPSAAILAMARERDLPIVFGSDAHEPEHVGADFEQAVATARAAGYTHVLTWRARRSEAVPLPG